MGGYPSAVSRFARAFVTGASSGLGRAVALLLAADGVEVVAAARREVELERLVAEVDASGGRAHACVLDASEPDRVLEVVRSWDDRLGGFDLVLANAGTAGRRSPGDLCWSDLDEVYQVNLVGASATLVAASEPMVARGAGTLAAVTSLAGVRGMPGSGSYSASKAGLIAFLETLRADLEPRGLTVCDIRPGFVRTAMTEENRFKMPFLMEVPAAARKILTALERGTRVCAFPASLAIPLGLARLVPAGAWNALARRAHPRGARASKKSP